MRSPSPLRRIHYLAGSVLAFVAAGFVAPLPGVAAIATSVAEPPVSNKPLVAKHSGKCLDVRGGPTQTANGALIEQWTCTGEANQNWTLRETSDGQYQIIAQSSGKCIETVNGGTANLTRIQQSDCNGQSRQLWRMQSAGTTGEYRFVHVPSGRCLDVTGGVTATGDGVLMELWDCTGQANQTWTIGAPPPSGTPSPTGTPSPSGTPPVSGTGPYGQDANLYTLTFADEFDGTSLNTQKWVDRQWYLPADSTPNYVVGGGSLKIFPVAGTQYKRDYRHITTDDKYYQTYGYFEMDAKLPYGKGLWPAFWLYNHDSAGNYRPEIDIMEAYPGHSGWSDANRHPTAFAATVWEGTPSDTPAGMRMHETTDLSAGYHKYGVKWEPTRLTFYFDGQPFYTLNISMTHRMYILLSLQFGGASGDGDASTPTGQQNSFDIRYVRAWKFR